jgi:hypothetical protein
MTDQPEHQHFINWQRGLAENTLSSVQLQTLQDMVDSGQAKDVQNAAAILDWQDSIIDPEEHMYGF